MKRQVLDQHHQSAGQTTIEPDNLPVKPIAWFVVALVVIVAGVMIGMRQLYWFTTTNLVQTNELDVPNKLLSELNASDKDQLSTYDVVDPAKGLYRIPIDEAMKLYVKQNGN
jgi:hypothetical protein